MDADWFWARTKRGPADACWLWQGPRNLGGYGTTAVTVRGRRTHRSAHRASYALAHGLVPGDLVVRHRCDNPPCVNPAHLETGTAADNARDRWERGADTAGTRNPLNALSPTEKQLVVLRMVAAPLAAGLPSPTIREMCAALGLVSTNGVNDHLKALVRKGLLQKCGHRVGMTDLGWAAVGLSPANRRSA